MVAACSALCVIDAIQTSNKFQSRGLRSSIINNLDKNDDAFNVKTVNFKELSCYVCKDVLGSDEDTPFLLYIAKELDGHFNKLLSNGAKEQRLLKFAGDV